MYISPFEVNCPLFTYILLFISLFKHYFVPGILKSEVNDKKSLPNKNSRKNVDITD